MKILKNLKKAFTLIETIVVIAVVAVLAGVSVGIYFGVSSGDPETEAVSKQEKVLEVWNTYISDTTDYSSGLNSKVHEFCTGYAEKQGIDVKLNYRVMEYKNGINGIINDNKEDVQNKIHRAYDPIDDSNELALIKIESTYPSYFLSTLRSVVEVSTPFETFDFLMEDIYSNEFVVQSYVCEYYEKEYSAQSFHDYFFELSDIVVNNSGETRRGIRYIRYDVYNKNNEYYKTVYGRANRTLNQEAGGTYTPGFVQNDSLGIDHIIIADKFILTETDGDQKFYYDPNLVYEYNENYSYDKNLETVKYVDENGQEQEIKATLSTSKDQYLVTKRAINFESTLYGGTHTGTIKPGEGEYQPDFDINSPINPDELPDDSDTSTNPETSADYPITLFFGSKVRPQGNDIISWLKRLFGIYEDTLKYVYFRNFKTLKLFISSPEFDGLVPISEDGGDPTKVIFVNGQDVILDESITFKDNFIFTIDSSDMTSIGYRKHHHEEWYLKYKSKHNKGIYGNDQTNVLKGSSNPKYESSFGTKENSLIIPDGKSISFINGAKMFLEGEIKATRKGYGFEVDRYAHIQNEGTIRFNNATGARISGIIEGKGNIIVENGAIISEPFKVADYLERDIINDEYVNKSRFFSDFYFLDSIRCEMNLKHGSTYKGYTPFYHYKSAAKNKEANLFLNFDIISPNTSACLFTSINANITKSCDNKGITSLVLNSGTLEYCGHAFTAEDSVYIDNTLFETKWHNSGVEPAFDKFNNVKTGFKLSNMNFILSSGSTLILNDYEKSDGDWHSGRLEILPSSMMRVEEGAKLSIGSKNALIVNDFYGDSYWKQYIKDRISGESNVLDRFNKLESIYNSNKHMLDICGEVNYSEGTSVEQNEEVSFTYTKTTCNHTKERCRDECDSGIWVTRDCKEEKVTSRHYTYNYKASAIFTWNTGKIIGTLNNLKFKDTFNSKLYDHIDYHYLETHTHTQTNCKNRSITYEITYKTTYLYNSFNYYGIALPTFELRPIV